MTGYYEPEIRASRTYKKGFYPIYKKNTNNSSNALFTKSRKKINSGILENKGLEIAWVESEIEAFFLHIQGSGRLKLKSGEVIKVRAVCTITPVLNMKVFVIPVNTAGIRQHNRAILSNIKNLFIKV